MKKKARAIAITQQKTNDIAFVIGLCSAVLLGLTILLMANAAKADDQTNVILPQVHAAPSN